MNVEKMEGQNFSPKAEAIQRRNFSMYALAKIPVTKAAGFKAL